MQGAREGESTAKAKSTRGIFFLFFFSSFENSNRSKTNITVQNTDTRRRVATGAALRGTHVTCHCSRVNLVGAARGKKEEEREHSNQKNPGARSGREVAQFFSLSSFPPLTCASATDHRGAVGGSERTAPEGRAC